MNTLGEGLFYQTPTPGANLTGVMRIDQHHTVSSVFSFLRRASYQLPPCGVGDAFSEAVILDHPLNVQVLETNNVVFVNELVAQLMSEVGALVDDALVNASNDLALPGVFRGALVGLAQPALCFCEGLLLLTEEAGISDLLAIGKRGESCQTQI